MIRDKINDILASKSKLQDDGRILIVPDYCDFTDLVDELEALFSLYAVVQPEAEVWDCPICEKPFGDKLSLYNHIGKGIC